VQACYTRIRCPMYSTLFLLILPLLGPLFLWSSIFSMLYYKASCSYFPENVSFDHYFATYQIAANNSGSGEPLFLSKPKTPSVNGLLSAELLTHNPNLQTHLGYHDLTCQHVTMIISILDYRKNTTQV
jgi:hypothetical protein